MSLKTYFGIKTGKHNEYRHITKLLSRGYGWIGNWLRQHTDPLIEQDTMLFNVLNPSNTGNNEKKKTDKETHEIIYDSNKNIRDWVAHENIRVYLKNLKVGSASSLSPNIKLRF